MRAATNTWEDAFRREIWAVKSKTPRKSPRHVLEALQDLNAQSQPEQHLCLAKIDPQEFWNTEKGLSGTAAHLAPLNLLLDRYGVFENFSQRGKHGRRFTSLLIWHQVHQELKKSGSDDRLHMPGSNSDVSRAIEQVATDHKVDVGSIERRRYEANAWLRLVDQFGPGVMLLPRKDAMYVCGTPLNDHIIFSRRQSADTRQS
jgi:hypothetical protein